MRLLIIICLLLPAVALAVVEENPGTYALADFLLLGDAAKVADEVSLTNANPNSTGHAISLNGYCASEWEVTWESLSEGGSNTSSSLSSAVGFFSTNGFHELAEWLSATTPSSLNSLKSFATATGTSTGLGRSSNNFLEMIDYGNPAGSKFEHNPLFSLKGVWLRHTAFFRQDGTVFYTVRDPQNRVYAIGGKVSHQPALPFQPGFYGQNGDTQGQHRIRNAGFRLILEGRCGIISSDEARARLGVSCGFDPACGSYSSYLNCVSETLLRMRDEDEVITQATFELLQSEAESKSGYCDGVNECSATKEQEKQQSYDSGFSAGVQSIDQTAIFSSGREEGYAAGYGAGFSAGESSGTAAGYATGYDAGFLVGSDSGYDSGYSAGYGAGYTAGSVDGDTLGYQRGFATGKAEALSELEQAKAEAYAAGFKAGQEASSVSTKPAEHDLCNLGATEVLSATSGAGLIAKVLGRDPRRTLGQPKEHRVLNFFSLGAIELGFGERAIYNRDGEDFRVVESPFRSNKQSCAEVFATQDGANWVSLGTTCTSKNFDLGQMEYAVALRIVDRSSKNRSFSLDGISCVR